MHELSAAWKAWLAKQLRCTMLNLPMGHNTTNVTILEGTLTAQHWSTGMVTRQCAESLELAKWCPGVFLSKHSLLLQNYGSLCLESSLHALKVLSLTLE